MREVESLPEPRQLDVLAFIRFLRIGLADAETVERRSSDALGRARGIATECGITEQDINDEIQTVKSER